MRRRPFIAGLLPAVLAARPGAASALAPPAQAGNPPLGVSRRALRFPADHGSHPDTHVEWWYVTGWLRGGTEIGAASAQIGAAPAQIAAASPPEFGFQVTFFRSRTELAEGSASRFAARQLVFAHVALTDLAAGANGGGLMHDQRAAREGFGLVQVPSASGAQLVQLRDWSLLRQAPASPDDTRSRMHAVVRTERFALDLDLSGTQPVLLQGEAGYSRKGPGPLDASHYYSEPQLAVRGRLELAGAPARNVVGRAWLDHEWSDHTLGAQAVGWDWVGFNLDDGAALMAFRLRRADGSATWAGGSYRSPAGELRNFAADEVRFEAQRHWTSPHTQASYPVEWLLTTPSGRWRIAALRDDQELDSRNSTGSVYWEGLSALKREDGRVVGHGYLELTGYAGRLRL